MRGMKNELMPNRAHLSDKCHRPPHVPSSTHQSARLFRFWMRPVQNSLDLTLIYANFCTTHSNSALLQSMHHQILWISWLLFLLRIFQKNVNLSNFMFHRNAFSTYVQRHYEMTTVNVIFADWRHLVENMWKKCTWTCKALSESRRRISRCFYSEKLKCEILTLWRFPGWEKMLQWFAKALFPMEHNTLIC